MMSASLKYCLTRVILPIFIWSIFIYVCPVHTELSIILLLMRKMVWVTKFRVLIQSIVHNGKICMIYRKNFDHQIMAVLPSERTMLSRPFIRTGLDFAESFNIKSYIGHGYRNAMDMCWFLFVLLLKPFIWKQPTKFRLIVFWQVLLDLFPDIAALLN